MFLPVLSLGRARQPHKIRTPSDVRGPNYRLALYAAKDLREDIQTLGETTSDWSRSQPRFGAVTPRSALVEYEPKVTTAMASCQFDISQGK